MINLSDREILTHPVVIDALINNMKDLWYLRMECDSFLMLVNKDSNEYVNLYSYGDSWCQSVLRKLASQLEKHPNMEMEIKN